MASQHAAFVDALNSIGEVLAKFWAPVALTDIGLDFVRSQATMAGRSQAISSVSPAQLSDEKMNSVPTLLGKKASGRARAI